MEKKQKFEIHLKGTGASKKPDKLKVEFFLNLIGDSWLEIYSNYLPEHDDRGRGEAKLLARNPDNYATVLAKFEAYFKRGDVKPMLREKFRLHLRREAAETFDSWVVIVKEGPPNASFLSIFTSELWETNSPFFARRTVIIWNFMTREPPFHSKILWRSCFWEELRNVSCKSQRAESKSRVWECHTARSQVRLPEAIIPAKQQELWILQSPTPPWTEEFTSGGHPMQQVQQTGAFSHNLPKHACSHGQPSSWQWSRLSRVPVLFRTFRVT